MASIDAKYLLKLLVVIQGYVIASSLSRESTVAILEITSLKNVGI